MKNYKNGSSLFEGLSPDNYNPKAREAFGRSLIEIGNAINKGMVLLFTVLPVTIVLRGVVFPDGEQFDIIEMLGNFTFTSYIALLVFIVIAFGLGHHFRKEGLRHIHEAEDKT